MVERGALQLRAEERGALELRAEERGDLELRGQERDALEIRDGERGAVELRAIERGALKMRVSSEAPCSCAPSSRAPWSSRSKARRLGASLRRSAPSPPSKLEVGAIENRIGKINIPNVCRAVRPSIVVLEKIPAWEPLGKRVKRSRSSLFLMRGRVSRSSVATLRRRDRSIGRHLPSLKQKQIQRRVGRLKRRAFRMHLEVA